MLWISYTYHYWVIVDPIIWALDCISTVDYNFFISWVVNCKQRIFFSPSSCFDSHFGCFSLTTFKLVLAPGFYDETTFTSLFMGIIVNSLDETRASIRWKRTTFLKTNCIFSIMANDYLPPFFELFEKGRVGFWKERCLLYLIMTLFFNNEKLRLIENRKPWLCFWNWMLMSITWTKSCYMLLIVTRLIKDEEFSYQDALYDSNASSLSAKT
jgi:hypothetical protein